MTFSTFVRPTSQILEADTEFRLLIERFEYRLESTTRIGNRRLTAIVEAHRALVFYEHGLRDRALTKLQSVTNALELLNLSVLLAERAIIAAARAADNAIAVGADRLAGTYYKEGTISLEAAEANFRAQRYTRAQRLAKTAQEQLSTAAEKAAECT